MIGVALGWSASSVHLPWLEPVFLPGSEAGLLPLSQEAAVTADSGIGSEVASATHAPAGQNPFHPALLGGIHA